MSVPKAETAPYPYAWGGPTARGRLREQPEDFQVDECLPFQPSGGGEHVLVKIRKRGENTLWVARRLARVAGVAERDVGYAGLKDRHAVTSQWFSVGLAGKPEPDWSAVGSESIEVLESARHNRKLRPGAAAGNRFRLRVRGIDGDGGGLDERLEQVRGAGVPNYFGEQRFGHDGDNLAQARALFGGTLRVRDRKLRGIYLSAARAWIFNAVLAERVSAGSWNRALAGDVMNLDARRAVFATEMPDDELRGRIQRLEIHPTGPLWGRGTSMAGGEAALCEQRIAQYNGDLTAGLERAGLEQERRALRVRVGDLQWARDGDTLELAFTLPSGSFATVVVREIVDYGPA